MTGTEKKALVDTLVSNANTGKATNPETWTQGYIAAINDVMRHAKVTQAEL